LDGRAAIQWTELLWRNDDPDTVTSHGEYCFPSRGIRSAGFGLCSTIELLAKAF
jgi:hypothetical protein